MPNFTSQLILLLIYDFPCSLILTKFITVVVTFHMFKEGEDVKKELENYFNYIYYIRDTLINHLISGANIIQFCFPCSCRTQGKQKKACSVVGVPVHVCTHVCFILLLV